jgi:hypothetical protein
MFSSPWQKTMIVIWSVREGFYDRLSILSIKNKRIFNRWINNINENETKSINWLYRLIPSVSIHRSIADCAHLCSVEYSTGGCHAVSSSCRLNKGTHRETEFRFCLKLNSMYQATDETLLDQQRDVVVAFWAWCILTVRSYSRVPDLTQCTPQLLRGEGLSVKFYVGL